MNKAKVLILTLAFLIASATYADISVEAAYSKPAPEGNRAEVEIGTITLPDLPPADQVRVAMKCAQICQSDRRILTGTKKSEALLREIVLGHEGVGQISQLSPEAKATDLKVGTYVVVLPHSVPNGDSVAERGFPNLSPNMKHIGFSLNGVFAEQMDFPKYNIFPISNASEMVKNFGEDPYLEQMVNTEPLACVQRAFKLLDEKQPGVLNKSVSRILILGAGPMGLLHAMHARMKYPKAKVVNYDISPVRRALAKQIMGESTVLDSTSGLANTFDVVVTSTSSADANSVDAPKLIKNGGVILLFSGINLHAGESSPEIAGVNVEAIHRTEDLRQIRGYRVGSKIKDFTLLGSSLHSPLLLGGEKEYLSNVTDVPG